MYRIPVDPVASPNDQATLRRSDPGVLDLAQAMAAMGVLTAWPHGRIIETWSHGPSWPFVDDLAIKKWSCSLAMLA